MSDSLPDEATKFLKQMGLCISAWAQADEVLFGIFERYVGAPRTQSAIIYYRLPGLDVRFSLVKEIVESVWMPEPLQGRMLSRLPSRNGRRHRRDTTTRSATGIRPP